MEKRLYRSCKNRILGGVAGGVGEYFEIDPTLVRLVFALLVITAGFGFIAYLVAWAIVPMDPACETDKTGADEIREQAEKVASDIRTAAKKYDHHGDSVRMWIGVALAIFGLILLAEVVLGFSFWHLFWPGLVLITGILIIISSTKK